jgi:hypothetical protein
MIPLILAQMMGGIQAVTDGLILSYRGDSTADLSANGNTLVPTNMTYTTDHRGVANSAFRFNGTNASAVTTNALDLSTTNKVSISFWMRIVGNTNTCFICELSANSNSQNAFLLDVIIVQTWPTVFDRYTDGTSTQLGTFPSNNSNQWYHWVIVIDRSQPISSRISVYKDSVLQTGLYQSQTNTTTANFTNTHKLYIGSRGGSSLFAQIDLDDFRIYNRVLTQSEVTTLYNE